MLDSDLANFHTLIDMEFWNYFWSLSYYIKIVFISVAVFFGAFKVFCTEDGSLPGPSS